MRREFSKSSLIFLVTDHIAEEDIIYTLTEEDKNCSRRSQKSGRGTEYREHFKRQLSHVVVVSLLVHVLAEAQT